MVKLNIAIISSFNFHFECIGFLLELFNNHNISLYIKKNSDKYKWLSYYNSIYNNINNIYIDKFTNNILNNYNLVINLSSNDNCINIKNKKNFITLLHLESLKKNEYNEYNYYISLTPYIKGNNIIYIYPIFDPKYDIIKINNKIITFIGYYLNSNFDQDTLNFINNNKDYIFNFIIWGDNNYNNIKNLNNVNIYQKITTDNMINIIKESKYIMSKKYINYDRFSGQLSLAISFNKPLIIDEKSAIAYKLPGLIFKKNYTEIGNLNNIIEEQYLDLIDNIDKFKILTHNQNIENIDKILKNSC